MLAAFPAPPSKTVFFREYRTIACFDGGQIVSMRDGIKELICLAPENLDGSVSYCAILVTLPI